MAVQIDTSLGYGPFADLDFDAAGRLLVVAQTGVNRELLVVRQGSVKVYEETLPVPTGAGENAHPIVSGRAEMAAWLRGSDPLSHAGVLVLYDFLTGRRTAVGPVRSRAVPLSFTPDADHAAAVAPLRNGVSLYYVPSDDPRDIALTYGKRTASGLMAAPIDETGDKGLCIRSILGERLDVLPGEVEYLNPRMVVFGDAVFGDRIAVINGGGGRDGLQILTFLRSDLRVPPNPSPAPPPAPAPVPAPPIPPRPSPRPPETPMSFFNPHVMPQDVTRDHLDWLTRFYRDHMQWPAGRELTAEILSAYLIDTWLPVMVEVLPPPDHVPPGDWSARATRARQVTEARIRREHPDHFPPPVNPL